MIDAGAEEKLEKLLKLLTSDKDGEVSPPRARSNARRMGPALTSTNSPRASKAESFPKPRRGKSTTQPIATERTPPRPTRASATSMDRRGLR
jgi:hypothetical protein